MPVVASHCQTLPAGAGHSRSIINEPQKSQNWGGFFDGQQCRYHEKYHDQELSKKGITIFY